MKLRERRIGLLVLVIAASVSLSGATTRPLNPLVTRTPQTGTVPANCDEGLSPVPPPRVAVQDVPRPQIDPVEAPAPPSGSLRAALHETQSALARNDRPAFDANLSRARSLVTNYPTGAERRTGEELVRIYEGVARLWDAQFRDPFFAQDSPEYAFVSQYPGYAEAVRRSVLTDPSGQRFYPASESRDFLGRVAADRLRGIGIQAPTRVAGREPARPRPNTTTTSPSTAGTSPQQPQVATSRPPRRTTTATPGTVRPPRPRRSAPAIASRPRTSSPTNNTESRTPAPVTSAPGNSPNPSAPPTTAAVPTPATPEAGSEPAAPATASPAAGETPATATAGNTTDAGTSDGATSDVATTEGTTAGTDTSLTSAPATDTPATETGTASRARSVVLPTILILIGLVVLIVLFRASK